MNLKPEDQATVDEAVKNFSGASDYLAAALGALSIGQYLGWRGLLFVHSRTTLRGYEAVLGLSFKDVLPEKTEYTERLLGYRIADKLGKFWAVVKNEVQVQDKGLLEAADGQPDMFGGQHGRAT